MEPGPVERLTWLGLLAVGLAAVPAWVGAMLDLVSARPLAVILVAGGLVSLLHEWAENHNL